MRLPRRPPDQAEILKELVSNLDRFQEVMRTGFNPAPAGRYRHWDKLLFLKPPGNLTHREWWGAVKFARATGMKPLPLLDKRGEPFQFSMPDPALETVHRIDRDASGQIEISEQVTNPATRDRYLVSSLIEEAITSSQLEGAATTHRVAKEMIRSGRKPRNKSERMIANNFEAMKFIRGLKGIQLTPAIVLDLQRLLTNATLDTPDAAGRLRRSDEDISVWDERDGVLLHRPPEATELPRRLEAMCDFANQKSPGFFIHPVIRAIILHFWLAYDHPFADGNGRTARALFYWSMLRQGYWLCEYLSISRILKKAPSKYTRAFLYTETDSNDLTYFILYHSHVIERAIQELHQYLQRKMAEFRATTALLKQSVHFNYRQISLLSHALRHADGRYSIQSHRTSHGVVYQTARADLLDLQSKGLLLRQKIGRTFYFLPAEDLAERLAAGQKSRRGAGLVPRVVQ